jgi:hypothetical protein
VFLEQLVFHAGKNHALKEHPVNLQFQFTLGLVVAAAKQQIEFPSLVGL